MTERCERSLAGMKKAVCDRETLVGLVQFFLVKFPTVSSVETL